MWRNLHYGDINNTKNLVNGKIPSQLKKMFDFVMAKNWVASTHLHLHTYAFFVQQKKKIWHGIAQGRTLEAQWTVVEISNQEIWKNFTVPEFRALKKIGSTFTGK